MNKRWRQVAAGSALVALFALAVVPAAVRAEDMEKIPSADQIRLFQVLKQVGNTLYGIRITSSSTPAVLPGGAREMINSSISGVMPARPGNPVTPQATSSILSTAVGHEVERIAAPSVIGLYKDIRRIGNALWGVLKVSSSTPAIEPSQPFVAISGDLATCVSAAITAKDQAVAAAVSSAATSLSSAINDRGACQLTALESTGNQEANLQSCVKTFQDARQQTNQTAKAAQQSAWQTYRSSLKTCYQQSATSTAASVEPAGVLNNDGSDVASPVSDISGEGN